MNASSTPPPVPVSLEKTPATPPPLNQYPQNSDDFNPNLPKLLNEPRACNAGWGINWLTKAFGIMSKNFFTWIGMGIVYLLLMCIPFINSITSFFALVFIAGFIKGASNQIYGDGLKFEHLFAGFKSNLGPLIVAFLLYMLALCVIIIPVAIIAIILFIIMSDASEATIGLMMILGVIVFMAIAIGLSMLIWFAPALIILHDVDPTRALKMSFRACMKNIAPFLVYGLFGGIVMILFIVFTVGLGLFVALPVGMLVYYTSYRDVWTDKPISA